MLERQREREEKIKAKEQALKDLDKFKKIYLILDFKKLILRLQILQKLMKLKKQLQD